MIPEELTALFTTFAQMEEDCPAEEAIASVYPEVVQARKKAGLGHPTSCFCGGLGKVKVFSAVVRVRCRRATRVVKPCPDSCTDNDFHLHTGREHQPDCPDCHGLGTTASNIQEDWEKACMEKGWTVQFEPLTDGTVTCFIDMPNREVIGDPDPNPKAALLLAIEKAVKHE